MTKRSLCRIASIILSCGVTVYFGAVLIIFASLQYILRPNANVFWIVFLMCMSIVNAVLMVLSKSSTAYYLSMLSIFPYTILIHHRIAIIVVIIYLTIYITQKKLYIKIIGTIICVLLAIISFCLTKTDNNWSQSFETVRTNYYMSPNNTTELRVEEVYWFEKVGDYYDTYGYTVAVHKVNLINLGPIVFDGTYYVITDEEKLSQKPDVDIKWVDDDTCLINGESYNVGNYID